MKEKSITKEINESLEKRGTKYEIIVNEPHILIGKEIYLKEELYDRLNRVISYPESYKLSIQDYELLAFLYSYGNEVEYSHLSIIVRTSLPYSLSRDLYYEQTISSQDIITLINKTLCDDIITVYRIRALQDFGDVKKGDIGGFVHSYNNLSNGATEDSSWVYDNAAVAKCARIRSGSKIYNNSIITDSADVRDSIICGNIMISENAYVWSTNVKGDIELSGDILIDDVNINIAMGSISGSLLIEDSTIVSNNLYVTGEAKIRNALLKLDIDNDGERPMVVHGDMTNHPLLMSVEDFITISNIEGEDSTLTFYKSSLSDIAVTLRIGDVITDYTLEEFRHWLGGMYRRGTVKRGIYESTITMANLRLNTQVETIDIPSAKMTSEE